MTEAVFYQKDGCITRFDISGHTAEYDSEEARLVCAAVSSAVYFVANTVTEILGDRADIIEQDGHFRLTFENAQNCRVLSDGLKLHLTQLSQQYKNFIKIITEVQHDA